MTKDEALRLAWDALEDIGDEWGFTSQRTVPKRKEALTAIKESFANEALDKMAENARELGLDYEPAQEPVAWIWEKEDGYTSIETHSLDDEDVKNVGVKSIKPLYTTPPQRTWVGLTLDERIELAQDVDWAIGAYCEYAEKIEAKLKEKNNDS